MATDKGESPTPHDETEAKVLLDRFIETHSQLGAFDSVRLTLATDLVSQFARLAESLGFKVAKPDQGRTHVSFDYMRRADILLLRDGTIEVGHDLYGNTRGKEVPLRFSPVEKRLEGMRPVQGLPPGMQEWQSEPRSALAVLTEVVLAAMVPSK